jgi:hypothetical protein
MSMPRLGPSTTESIYAGMVNEVMRDGPAFVCFPRSGGRQEGSMQRGNDPSSHVMIVWCCGAGSRNFPNREL